MGLDVGCSTRWLHKPQMGRGRRVPSGGGESVLVLGLQSGQLPDPPDKIISTSPAFAFLKAKIP